MPMWNPIGWFNLTIYFECHTLVVSSWHTSYILVTNYNSKTTRINIQKKTKYVVLHPIFPAVM